MNVNQVMPPCAGQTGSNSFNTAQGTYTVRVGGQLTRWKDCMENNGRQFHNLIFTVELSPSYPHQALVLFSVRQILQA